MKMLTPSHVWLEIYWSYEWVRLGTFCWKRLKTHLLYFDSNKKKWWLSKISTWLPYFRSVCTVSQLIKSCSQTALLFTPVERKVKVKVFTLWGDCRRVELSCISFKFCTGTISVECSHTVSKWTLFVQPFCLCLRNFSSESWATKNRIAHLILAKWWLPI